jgi:galactose mutarotase-like enzyme
MGELIRIGAEEGQPGISAVVDTTGAWVTELTINGLPILFPKQEVSLDDGRKKIRGGMHVCSPYFGLPEIAAEIGIPQHGYARNVEWDVDSRNDLAVSLSHDRNDANYSGLMHTIDYKIYRAGVSRYDDTFSAMLTLIKPSGEPRDVPKRMDSIVVAPGFHPYFAQLNDTTLAPGQVRPSTTARYMGNSSLQTIRTGYGLEVAILSSEMPKVLEWTDKPDEYVCVEPNVSGDSLEPIDGAIELRSGELHSFVIEIAARELVNC